MWYWWLRPCCSCHFVSWFCWTCCKKNYMLSKFCLVGVCSSIIIHCPKRVPRYIALNKTVIWLLQFFIYFFHCTIFHFFVLCILIDYIKTKFVLRSISKSNTLMVAQNSFQHLKILMDRHHHSLSLHATILVSKICLVIRITGFRATLSFWKLKVALNTIYRFFWKKTASDFENIYIKKTTLLFLNYRLLKLKFRGF